MVEYAYLRVSSKEQNEGLQREAVAPLVGEEAVWVTERVSAFKDNLSKREFKRVYDDVLAGGVSLVAVWDLDRLFRNRLKLVEFFRLCRAKGTIIRSARQKFLRDIEAAPAPWNEILFDMMLQVLGWIAEEESRHKGERVRLAVRRGDGPTRSYKGNRWGRKPLPLQAVRRIRVLGADGWSVRAIAAEVRVWDAAGNSHPVSRGAVHKILRDFEGVKPRSEGVSENGTISGRV